MKRGHITQQIDSLRKEMNNSMTAQFISLYEDFDTSKLKNHQIEGRRYASNEKQSYILVKNVKKKEENAIFKTSTLDDDYNRFKEKDEWYLCTKTTINHRILYYQCRHCVYENTKDSASL